MVPHSSPLTVKFVVDGPGEVLAAAVGAAAVGTALDDRAHRSTAHLLGSTLEETLRKHSGRGWWTGLRQ